MPEITIGEKTYQLTDGITVVGRSDDADLTIESTKLSRMHARFTIKDDAVTVEDLDSKNGTFVNGTKLTSAHVVVKGDTILIADLKVEIPFPETQKPAEKKTAPAKKNGVKPKKVSPDDKQARLKEKAKVKEAKSKKNMINVVVGMVIAVAVLIGIGIVSSKQPEGLEEAQALIAAAEKDSAEISVSDDLEHNLKAVQDLETIKGRLSLVPPELTTEHTKAKSLAKDIAKKISKIEARNTELEAAKTSADRFATVMKEIQNEEVTPQNKVAKLEQYMSVFPNASENAKAIEKISEIKRTVRAEEKAAVRKAKTDAQALLREEKFAEAAEMLDGAITKAYYQLELSDISPLKDLKIEIIAKGEAYFKNLAGNAVKRAKEGNPDELLSELNSAFMFLRIPTAQPAYDSAVKKIKAVKDARIAEARKKLEADYKEAEALIAKRQYEEAHKIFERLLEQVTEQSFIKEINQKKSRNYLYALAKKHIISYITKKKGLNVEGVGFIQKVDKKELTIKVDLDSMMLGWERVKPEEFAVMTGIVAEKLPFAELYTACGLIHMDAGKELAAEKWLGKALASSPFLANDYPEIFKEFKAKLAARKAEIAKRKAEEAEAEVVKAKPVDLTSPWADYIDKTPWITDNKIYVSNMGDDRNGGSSPGKPMRTVKEALSKGSGKTILLQRGSVFREIPGKIGNGTVLSAYGPANLPLPRISGSIEIKNWKKHNGSIYVAQVDQDIKHLFCNGERMDIARYPNLTSDPAKNWLRTEAGTNSNAITVKALASHPRNASGYWNGAQVRWRKWSWWYETRPITNWDGSGVLRLGTKTELNHTGIGGGFYIDNKLEELDYPGEWYFDSANKKVYLFAPNGADPNKILVEGMCMDSALGASNCKIENICFSHQWDRAIGITRTVEVRNCRFTGQRNNAVSASWDASNCRVYGNFFEDVLNTAIGWNENSGSGSSSIVEYNVFKRIGAVPGYGGNGPWHSAGVIIINGKNFHLQKNLFEDIGYAGVIMGKEENFTEYNIFKRAMCTLNDGGAVYTNCDKSTIRYNLIFDTEGDLESSHPWANLGQGIWPEFLEEFKLSVIEYNTVLGSGAHGIFHPNNFENTVRYNVLYNNATCQLQLSGMERVKGRPQKNLFEGNVLFACAPTQATILFRPDYDYGTMKGNYFCNPHTSSPLTAYGTGGNKWSKGNLTIKSWQDKYSWADKEAKVDLDKNKSALLVINDTLETRDVPIPGTYRDLDGKGHSRKVTLEPFRSIVLVGGNHQPGAYITWTMMQGK